MSPALRVAFVTLFLDLLGFGLIIPIAPFYAESFGASPSTVMLIGASYSLMQFLFAPMWGALSDRYGRRPIILTSIAIAAVGFAIYGAATSLWVLFAARMISGFGNANIGTVHAIVADVTSGKDRARGMGLMGAAFGLGFVVGPVVGGLLGGAYGPSAPAYAAAGLCALNFLFALVKLPETRHQAAGHAGGERGLFGLRAIGRARELLNVPALLVLAFTFTVGFAMMEASLGLFVERTVMPAETLGTDAGHRAAARATAWLLLAAGVTSVIVQGGLIRRLKELAGEKALIIAGCALISVSFASFAAASTFGYAALFVPIVVLSFGSGMYSPSATSLLSRAARDDEQGAMLGVGQSMSALGRIFGPFSAGFIFESALGPAGPFYVGAALLGVCVVVALTLKRPAPDG